MTVTVGMTGSNQNLNCLGMLSPFIEVSSPSWPLCKSGFDNYFDAIILHEKILKAVETWFQGIFETNLPSIIFAHRC